MDVGTLHTKHGAYLLKCLRLYGVPEQECEDVRQDLYLKLLENDTDLSKIRQPKGYCSRIARNAAVDFLRKSNRAPTMESMIVIDEDGFEGMHLELNAKVVAEWENFSGDTNVGRINEAMELAQMYECQPGVTAFEVIIDLLYGLTMEQIGEKHEVGHSTVSRWMRDWQKWVSEKLPNPNGGVS